MNGTDGVNSRAGTSKCDVDDALYDARPIDAVITALKQLAAEGPALELGVGSGRVAVALASAGVDVTGIDSSSQLLDALQDGARDASVAVPTVLGNFRDFEGGPYRLIYAVCNSFCELLDQDDQVACFANASQALAENGVFLVETTLLHGREDGWVSVEAAGEKIVLRFESYDRVAQIRSMATMVSAGQGLQIIPRQVRYTSLAELDLIARLAGLDLKERWGGWTGDPVTPFSPSAISLYQLQTATR